MNQMKRAEEQRHEGKMRALASSIKNDPEWKDAHQTADADENPQLEAMNEVMQKRAKKKIN